MALSRIITSPGRDYPVHSKSCGSASIRRSFISQKSGFSMSCPSVVAVPDVRYKEWGATRDPFTHNQVSGCKHRETFSQEAEPSCRDIHLTISRSKLALKSSTNAFHSRREMVEWIRQSCESDNDVQSIFVADGNNTPVGHKVNLASSSGTFQSTQSFAHGKGKLQSLEFDSLTYPTNTLVDLCVEVFLELELDTALGIDRQAIRSFALNVQNQMVENPYHNWFHVVDDTQTIYSLGLQSGILQDMSCKEKLALLVAALCHDLDHPGVNNAFLIKTRSALASQYSMNAACLEQHHSVRASELMTNESGTGLLDGLCPADRHEIIARVQTIILATDMGRHGDYCARLKSLVDQRASAGTAPLDESQRQLVAELLIKCADTSNVLKPFPVAKRWAVRITDEFFKQGDLERSLGMEVSALCDRHSESRVALQKGFIGFIAPFYRAMGELLPGLAPLGERLQRTRDMWETYASDEVLLAEVSKESQWE